MSEAIKNFLQTAYSDEKLAALLAHAEDGKLAYYSCCCFIGAATADHPLQGKNEIPDDSHTSDLLPYANEAETEYVRLGNDDAERRAKLIPMIRAEMTRRDAQRIQDAGDTMGITPVEEALRVVGIGG